MAFDAGFHEPQLSPETTRENQSPLSFAKIGDLFPKTARNTGGIELSPGFPSGDMLLAQLKPESAQQAGEADFAASIAIGNGELTEVQQDRLAAMLSNAYNSLPVEQRVQSGRAQQDVLIEKINKQLTESGSALRLETEGDNHNTGRRGSLRTIVIKNGEQEVSSFTFNSRDGYVERY